MVQKKNRRGRDWKDKLDPYFTLFSKIYSRWISASTWKIKLKILEENMREYTFDLEFKYFFNDNKKEHTTRLICLLEKAT